VSLVRGVLLLLVLMVGLAPRAAGQNTTLQASALLLEPLEAGALEHLRLGLAIPGDSAEVLATNAAGTTLNPEAGAWQVRTKLNTGNVYVAFTLPATLTHTQYPAITLPMDWNSNKYLALCEMTASGCINLVRVNPWNHRYPNPYNYVLAQGKGIRKDVRIHLGGKVKPTRTQRAGDYLGTVTLHFYSTN